MKQEITTGEPREGIDDLLYIIPRASPETRCRVRNVEKRLRPPCGERLQGLKEETRTLCSVWVTGRGNGEGCLEWMREEREQAGLGRVSS